MDGRQADPGVLVRQSWAERVDAAVGAGDAQRAAQAVESSRQSLYYDVRPVRITGARWTQSGQSRWYVSSARFIDNAGKVDTLFEFPIYACRLGGVYWKQGAEAHAVWRGRWELLDGGHPTQRSYQAGAGISFDNPTTTDVTINNAGFYIARARTIGGGYDYIYPHYAAPGTLCFDSRWFKVDQGRDASKPDVISLEREDHTWYYDIVMPVLETRDVNVYDYLLYIDRNDDGLVTNVRLVKTLDTSWSFKAVKSYTPGSFKTQTVTIPAFYANQQQ